MKVRQVLPSVAVIGLLFFVQARDLGGQPRERIEGAVAAQPAVLPASRVDLRFVQGCMVLPTPVAEGATDYYIAEAARLQQAEGAAAPTSYLSAYRPTAWYRLSTSFRNLGLDPAQFQQGWAIWRQGGAIHRADAGGTTVSPGDEAWQLSASVLEQDLEAGPNVVAFELDPENRIVESDETNNRVECSINVVAPDLMVAQVSVSQGPGGWVATPTVRNAGTESVPIAFPVDCTPGGRTTMNGLAAGETRQVSFAFVPPPSNLPVPHAVRCTVDPSGAIPEPNRENNTSVGSYTLQRPRLQRYPPPSGGLPVFEPPAGAPH